MAVQLHLRDKAQNDLPNVHAREAFSDEPGTCEFRWAGRESTGTSDHQHTGRGHEGYRGSTGVTGTAE